MTFFLKIEVYLTYNVLDSFKCTYRKVNQLYIYIYLVGFLGFLTPYRSLQSIK